MRAFFITLVLLAGIAGGVYYYWRENPEAFAARDLEAPVEERRTTREAPPRPRAEFCSAQDAVYQWRGAQNVKLRLVAGPGQVAAQGSGVSSYDNLGTLLFVVSAGEREFRFAAASSLGVTINYLFPMRDAASVTVPAGVDLIQMSAFDSNLNYVSGLPRLDHAAPAHIFAPNLTRWLYSNGGEPRIEAPVAMIDFASCEPGTPDAQSAAADSAPATETAAPTAAPPPT
jgi:hypothetical protein